MTMRPYCYGTAVIEHQSTGKQFEIASSELNFEIESIENRSSGVETHYQARVEHDRLGLMTWDLWEYPEDVFRERDYDVKGHKIITNFKWGLENIEEINYDEEILNEEEFETLDWETLTVEEQVRWMVVWFHNNFEFLIFYDLQ